MHFYKTKYTWTEPVNEETIAPKKRRRRIPKPVVKSESLLIKAANHGDAETQTFQEAGSRSDLDVPSVARAKFWDIIGDGSVEGWYKGKLVLLESNFKTGKVKRKAVAVLVNATSNPHASEQIIEHMKTISFDYELENVDKTDIVEVIRAPKTKG
ncbi:DUF4494 family protein [Spirosoma aerophilum]